MGRLAILVAALWLLGCAEHVRVHGISGGYRYSFEPPDGWLNMGARDVMPRYVLREASGAEAVLTTGRTVAFLAGDGCGTVHPWTVRYQVLEFVESAGMEGSLFLCRGDRPGGAVVAALAQGGEVAGVWLVVVSYRPNGSASVPDAKRFVPVVKDVLETLEVAPR